MKFSSKLKLLRQIKGLDQNEMSKLLNVSQPVYSRYENGEKDLNVSTEFIQRVAAEFGVQKEWLMDEQSSISVVFDNGSINTGVVGNVDNYYSVPKDFLDALNKQIELFDKLLSRYLEK